MWQRHRETELLPHMPKPPPQISFPAKDVGEKMLGSEGEASYRRLSEKAQYKQGVSCLLH